MQVVFKIRFEKRGRTRRRTTRTKRIRKPAVSGASAVLYNTREMIHKWRGVVSVLVASQRRMYIKKNDIADVFHQGNLLLFVYPTYHYYYSWRDVYELDLYLYGAMLD